MTKDDAIKILQANRHCVVPGCTLHADQNQALDLAIDTLREQPDASIPSLERRNDAEIAMRALESAQRREIP